MYDWFQRKVTHLIRVPPEPHAPFGAPGSTRIFRAGKNYFNLRLLGWSIAQFIALAAIIFWAVILIDVEAEIRKQKASRGPLPAFSADTFAASISGAFEDKPPAAGQPAAAPAAATQPNANTTPPGTTPATAAPAEVTAPAAAPTEAAKPAPTPKKAKKKYYGQRFHLTSFDGFKRMLVEVGLRLPDWAFPLIWGIKIAGFVAYLAQIPFTYALRRLDYELRWYIVTDRSLRIRAGLVRLQESTMSFANIQQVEVKQNPIQRLLRLADVHVQSAGGGGDHSQGEHAEHDSLHTGIFHSVENATEIRDLILERLRQFRQAGLGDPDDHHDHPAIGATVNPEAAIAPANPDALAAAQAILAEAKALRAALTS